MGQQNKIPSYLQLLLGGLGAYQQYNTNQRALQQDIAPIDELKPGNGLSAPGNGVKRLAELARNGASGTDLYRQLQANWRATREDQARLKAIQDLWLGWY
jgi:hypothetical protein